MLPKADRKDRFPGYSRADVSFKEAMKILAARTPDSQFLLQIKDMEGCDEGTQSLIQEVQDFARTTFSSLIDTTVEAMTRAVLTKQQELCSAPGICQIDTEPQCIEATFTGGHETFQYTSISIQE
jgi:hypothetical protein